MKAVFGARAKLEIPDYVRNRMLNLFEIYVTENLISNAKEWYTYQGI